MPLQNQGKAEFNYSIFLIMIQYVFLGFSISLLSSTPLQTLGLNVFLCEFYCIDTGRGGGGTP